MKPAFFLAAFILTCTVCCSAQPPVSSGGRTISLTMADNGKTVDAAAGDIIEVRLEFQGGTGFSWYPDRLDESRLKLVGTRTESLAPAGVVGGKMLGIWDFQAAAPGETELTMLYYRIFEGRESAANKFSVHAVIKGQGVYK